MAVTSANGRKVLHAAGIEVRIVDPKRVRSFALSAGRLAKNDAIDAEIIRLVRRDVRRGTEPDARCRAEELVGIGEIAHKSD